MRKIMLSIKPCYVKEILAGRKLVEYRKRVPQDHTISQVLIYSSYPIKKVVAEFQVGGYLTASPKNLWQQTFGIGGIKKDVFDKYFENKDVAYAYQITNLQMLSTPKPLSDFGLKHGPQDYCYVED